MNEENLKDLVNPEVYDKIDKSTELWDQAKEIHNTMQSIEAAHDKAKKLNDHSWNIAFQVGGITTLRLENSEVLSAEILEAIKNFLALLEAIHYAERKAVIKEFNNSLKTKDDGK